MSYLLGLMYVLGATLCWDGLRTKEIVLSLTVKRTVRMFPLQKSMACAVWPLVAVYILWTLLTGADNQGEMNDG